MEPFQVRILKNIYARTLDMKRERIYKKNDIVLVIEINESIYCALKNVYIPKKDEGKVYELLKS